jgi:carbonic anhydrase/acetyltransferase-like protein (isoleucine patch superfamily)
MKKYESGLNGSIYTYKGITPKIHPSAFICEGVRIVGDVEIGENVSVWYNSVIRGDVHYIRIGKNSNIQDLCMLHVTNQRYALNIGENVSLGHSVTVHGCTIKDNVLIGMGALVLDNATINSHSLVAAGAVVKENFVVPEGVLVAGVPAKIIKDLKPEEIERITSTAPNYIRYAQEYRDSIEKV